MASKAEQAAQYLLAARQAGEPGDRIPEEMRPETMAEAYAVQEAFLSLTGLEIGGWKCAPPGKGKGFAAPVFSVNITSDNPTGWERGETTRIEPEVAYVLKHDLPPRGTPYSEEEVRAAIGETRLVLELLGSRYRGDAQASAEEMVADFQQGQGIYIGPVIANPEQYDLTGFPVTIKGNKGYALEHQGVHPCEHPFVPFFWLANFLNTRGTGLRKGEIVITGSYAGAVTVPYGEELTVVFGDIGELTATVNRP